MVESHKGNSRVLIELVSAAAVLIGLFIVGYELKQNTDAVEAATLQGITDSAQDYLLLMAADPELSRIWRVANDDPNALNESDASRYFFLLRAQWQRYQSAYLQWQRGAMSDTDWILNEKFICDSSASTTAQTKKLLWSDHRDSLSEDFVRHVEACWNVDQDRDE